MNIRHDMVYCYAIRRVGARWEVLQLLRAAGDFMGGTWQTVAGRIEAGETAPAAALRELREETGLVPAEFYQLDRVNTFYMAANDTMYHCPAFCAVVPPEAKVQLNEEHQDHRWIDLSSATAQFLWPGERDAIGEIIDAIIGDAPAKKYMRLG